MTTSSFYRISLLAISLFATSGANAEDKSFDRHFDAPSGGRLSLQTDVGSVSVVGHDSRDVDVHVEISGVDADQMTLDATQDASDVKVTGGRKSISWFQWSVMQAKFTISVPRDYPVRIQTSGGSIDAARLNGPVLLRTSGGSIDVTDAVGDVDVHTSGGSIELDNIDGKVTADTSGGGIRAAVRNNRGITLTTSGGSIALRLPHDVRAAVGAQTSGGSARSELPVSTTESDRQHLLGTINGGWEPIYLRTSGGGIRISDAGAR